MAKRPTAIEIKGYALVGAAARIEELRGEIERIYRTFPSLRRGPKPLVSPEKPVARVRRRKKFSAATRKAISQRMKKLWAARKKAKK